MTDFIILLPPSEGKKGGGTLDPLGQSNTRIGPILERLNAYKGSPEALLGVKGKALEQAIQANRAILTSPTMPAIERYAGVVYDGIGYSTLGKSARDYLNRHVRIVSAVFGLVHPQDRIPDYKLKIEKLDADKYWRPLIAAQLKGAFVIDLLPQAHKKAVAYTQGMPIEFVFEKSGKPVPAGHNGKLIKGRFVRWLCEKGIADPRAVKDFNEDGFFWNGGYFLKKV